MKSLFFFLVFSLSISCPIGATVCYNLSNSGNTLIVSVMSSIDYTTTPNNFWVTGNVTLSWPGALGPAVITGSNGQNGFTFAPDGPAQLDMSTNTYYRKFGFTAAPQVTASLTTGVPLSVLHITVAHGAIATGDFSIVPAPPPSVVVNGGASFSNVFSERYAPGSCTLTAANVPLPVSLLLFDAEARESDIAVTWESGTERNFSGYELQRAGSNLQFEKIYKAAGKGSGGYNYVDKTVSAGVRYFYRLKMLDNDGSFAYSDFRSAMIPAKANAVQLYPNPVADYLFVDWGETEPLRLSIFDMHGRMVVDTATDWYRLNVTALPSGAYIVKTLDAAQHSTTLRFLK
jgi:Secretion system C-terminal sorting domain